MPVSVIDRLKDVADAADEIVGYLVGADLTSFHANDLLRSAVQFKFVVIGEALNALSKDYPETANRLGDVGPVISFRNKLVHGYRIVDFALVYSIARHELPKLRENVRALLAELDKN
jgi:uncharacterized protein with HEPN domain